MRAPDGDIHTDCFKIMNKDRSLTKNQINFETCHDPHTNSDSDESMSVVNVNDVRATIEELSRVVKEAK